MTVLVGTPAYDGKLDVYYVDSLVQSTLLCAQNDIRLFAIYMSFDALIQRARNDLVKLAVEHDMDALVFIDSDMAWNPEWLLELINSEHDVIGGTARKRTDEAEQYACDLRDYREVEPGLLAIKSIGTGFLKLSKAAYSALWESAPEYRDGDKTCRMVFDIRIENGELLSEDVVMCRKLKNMGYNIYLYPHMCCDHAGYKIYRGNLENYLKNKEK